MSIPLKIGITLFSDKLQHLSIVQNKDYIYTILMKEKTYNKVIVIEVLFYMILQKTLKMLMELKHRLLSGMFLWLHSVCILLCSLNVDWIDPLLLVFVST